MYLFCEIFVFSEQTFIHVKRTKAIFTFHIFNITTVPLIRNEVIMEKV